MYRKLIAFGVALFVAGAAHAADPEAKADRLAEALADPNVVRAMDDATHQEVRSLRFEGIDQYDAGNVDAAQDALSEAEEILRRETPFD